MQLKEQIQEVLAQINDLKAQNEKELEDLRIKYLSKKGIVVSLMNEFRNVSADQKRELGIALNKLKTEAQNKINQLRESMQNSNISVDADLDLTRTAYPIPLGTRHPISLVRNEIIDIFTRLGFSLADGPEVEDDLHVFTKMNFAADHPARDMQDTFFIENSPNDIAKNVILRPLFLPSG